MNVINTTYRSPFLKFNHLFFLIINNIIYKSSQRRPNLYHLLLLYHKDILLNFKKIDVLDKYSLSNHCIFNNFSNCSYILLTVKVMLRGFSYPVLNVLMTSEQSNSSLKPLGFQVCNRIIYHTG